MERTSAHRRRKATAFVLAVALACGSGLALAQAGPACPGVKVDGSWRRISTPLRAAGFAVDAGGRVYVAGDRAVMASTDGGCTWRTSLDLDAAPAPGLPAEERFTSIAVAGNVVVAAVTGPAVFVSDDRGATWERAGDGFDLPGEPLGLYPAPSGEAVYMLVRQSVSDGRLAVAGVPEQGVRVVAGIVYRSGDGGRTWTRGSDVGTSYNGPDGAGVEGGTPPGAVWDLAVDPADADHLLAAAPDAVFRSVDGGRSWSAAMFDPGAQVRAVALWRGAGGRPSAVAVDPRSGTLYEAPDAGGVWKSNVYPQLRTELMSTFPNGAAWAWAAAAPGGDVVLSGPKGIFRRIPEGLADVTAPGLGGPAQVAAGLQTAGGDVWGRLLDGSELVTEVAAGRSTGRTGAGAARGAVELGPTGSATGIPAAEVDAGRVALVPDRTRVHLAPGESATVSYEARLDPRPTRVDLYFLVDTTSSMSDTIRALVGGMKDVVLRLARSGIRLRAGVGAFRTYPRESDRVEEDYPYRRLRALGPVDAELLRSLYDLEGGGSSGANLTALYQSVTGEGQDVLPPGPSKADVAPGGDAGFRAGSLKVLMHLADTWFGTPERGDPSGYYAPGTWPGPTFDAAADALRSLGVMHLGVALQPGEGGTVLADADVVEDMRALSRATSSVAGARGADCDGDGKPDLRKGQPLVCLLDRGAGAGGLASVVTGLVEALERRGGVRLAEVGVSGLVSSIAPDVHDGVDLRAPQRLRFDVTVACGLDDSNLARTVSLELLVAGERVAASGLDVTCGDPTEATAAAPDAPSRTSTSLQPLLPIPVPPPPHPVPGPGPGSVTAPAPVQAPAPAQAPGGQPHAATVAQRQQQPQAAFAVAAQQVRAQTQMQHALVRGRTRTPLAEARLWTAVGALSLLWAWGIATAVVASARRARV